MARRYGRDTRYDPQAREEWNDRDVVPPRNRFGDVHPDRDRDRGYDDRRYGDRMQDDPDYMARHGRVPDERRHAPRAALGPGGFGWAPPYGETVGPATYPGGPGYAVPGTGRADDYWRRRDYDRMPGSEVYGYGYGPDFDHRNVFDRAADEVASWFGDDEAQMRREEDHRGRGPRNYRRSDARIEEDVNERLTEDRTVDATEVTVSVKDHEVTLDGYVQSRRAKRRAEDCADSVSGVTHVQNNLRVQDVPGAAGGAAPS